MGCNLRNSPLSFLLSSGRPLGDLKQELSEAFANLPPDNLLTIFLQHSPSYPPPPSPGLPVQGGKVRTSAFQNFTLSAHPVRRLA